MRYIKLQHELVHAQYNEEKGKWYLKIRRPVIGENGILESYEIFDDTADLVLAATGALTRWDWPKIDGLKSFKGTLIHSADWDTGNGVDDWKESVKGWEDKKVGVIGVGSTALQIVPALQPLVGKLKNYVRGKTWLATPFAAPKIAELVGRAPQTENCKIPYLHGCQTILTDPFS